MIKVYAFSTPNGVRVPIALEELELPYEIEVINVRKGEQKQPSFLAINPNGKVPVIVDSDGSGGQPFTLSESGAILFYLAEKTHRLMPADPFGRARVLAVLDGVLSTSEYVAGDAFTIADIAHFGWLWRREFAGLEFDRTPNIARWYAQIASRPAVGRAVAKVAALVHAT
jgi:GST-like protein